jgi:hypothetical protein
VRNILCSTPSAAHTLSARPGSDRDVMSHRAGRAAFAAMPATEQTHMLLRETIRRCGQAGHDTEELRALAAGITANSSQRDCDEAISRALEIYRSSAASVEEESKSA